MGMMNIIRVVPQATAAVSKEGVKATSSIDTSGSTSATTSTREVDKMEMN
jgi:hypothetical protein